MTELMKRYEAETGECARDELYSGSMKLYMPTNDYIAWLEAKTNAYDRLMSGSVQGMKEWANILGKPVAIDDIGRGWWFTSVPKIINGEWDAPVKALIPDLYIGSGISDWTTSLTMPDGWEDSMPEITLEDNIDNEENYDNLHREEMLEDEYDYYGEYYL